MVRQGVDVDISITAADIRQELREWMPGERSDQIRRRERPLRKETIDRARRRGRLEQEDDNRTVHTRTVQMNVCLEDSRDVMDIKTEMDGSAALVHPEDGPPGGQRCSRGR